MKKTIKDIVSVVVFAAVVLSMCYVILDVIHARSLKAYKEAYEEAYVESYVKAYTAAYEKAYREEVANRDRQVVKTETFYEYRDGIVWTVDRVYFEEN